MLRSIKISTFKSIALSAVFGLGVACGGTATENLDDDTVAVGEAEAYLTVSEEDPAVAEEAIGGMDDSTIEGAVDEEVSTEPSADDAVEPASCELGGRRARILAQYDVNQDGKLDRAERQTLRADLEASGEDHPRIKALVKHFRRAVIKRVHWAFDINGDHVLDDAERQELLDALQSRCEVRKARLLERFDANGDGQLDQAERQAVKEARKARLLAKRQEVLAEFDANGDGKLDLQERRAWRQSVIEAWKTKRQQIKAEFDANGDGTLDETERAALKAAIRERVANGRGAQEE
ncbi:MAG: hypothetical protein HY791_19460 [Deltaproteobacteria bacterium]|nr:hypothetical protein [Deltaproteobacteria bacterium]